MIGSAIVSCHATDCNSKVVRLVLAGVDSRSSAFYLGALQALDTHKLIEKLDYISIVSSGSYIEMSMTAAMSAGMARHFPFASELRTG